MFLLSGMFFKIHLTRNAESILLTSFCVTGSCSCPRTIRSRSQRSCCEFLLMSVFQPFNLLNAFLVASLVGCCLTFFHIGLESRLLSCPCLILWPGFLPHFKEVNVRLSCTEGENLTCVAGCYPKTAD